MKTSLPLSDVVFTYTSQDGMPAMELTTTDPRLAGKHFRVRIPRASPTYRSLLALLEAEALLPPVQEDIPISARVESVQELLERANAHELPLGLGAGGTPIGAPLSTPHLLVAGAPGSGKTILLRNVVASILTRPRTRLLLGTLTPQELGAHTLREYDSEANTLPAIERLIATLQQKLHEKKRRFAAAEAAGEKPRRVRKPSTFLVLDDAEALVSATTPGVARDELLAGKSATQLALLELLQDGPRFGIYVVLSTKSLIGSRELIRRFGTRVVLNEGEPTTVYDVLGQAAYEGPVLRHRGRGIVSSYGAHQKLFQGYFLPFDALQGNS